MSEAGTEAGVGRGGQPLPRMGMATAVALVVGNVIGGGVFMLPAALAPSGWNAFSGWLLTLCGALCLALLFSRMGRHFPDSGGAYGFLDMSLGEGPAFVGAWGYWISVWSANAAIAISGVAYLVDLLPGLKAVPLAIPLLTSAMLWLFTLVNLFGIRLMGPVQVVTTLVKLIPLLAVCLLFVGVMVSRGGDGLPSLHALKGLSFDGTAGVAVMTLYAMLGIESAAVPADRVRDPARTIPAATLLGTAVTGILSMACCCAYVLMVPPGEAAAAEAPLSLLLGRSLGGWAGVLVGGCALVSAYGAINGWVLLSGELPASMALRGRLPAWFGRRNRHGAAAGPILLGSLLSTVLVCMNHAGSLAAVFSFAILLSTASSLVLYLLCSIGAFRLMRFGQLPRTPVNMLVIGGSIAFALGALAGAGREALLWGGVLLLCGWPLHLLARKGRYRGA